MNLRKKTIIIIGMTLVGLILVLCAISQFFVMNSYLDLEEKETIENIEVVQGFLCDDLNAMSSTGNDWGSWDDTYEFIEDGNEDYINSNLMDATFINLRLNLMMFVNSSGHIVFMKGVDLENETEMPFPQSLVEQISDNDLLLRHNDTTSYINGFLLLPEGPMLVVSRPILNSFDEGPIRGSLIIGRYLNSEEIERVAKKTKLSLSVIQFNDPEMPSDFLIARSSFSMEKPYFIRPLGDESIAGYTLFNDVYGKPIFILRVDKPRDIYYQGKSTMLYFILSLIGSGLVFGLAILLLLERSVLSPMALLTSDIKAIGKSGDHSARVSHPESEELSDLADVINKMLEELQQAEEAKKKDLLLKEIYHRVKNNLQIVSSLLSLQADKMKDKEIVEIFKESQNRIKSMALIHERLYKSKDMAGINFREYIDDLTLHLFRSYGINPGDINLKLDIDEVIFNLDTATPVGLIVTELVSNSLKYAFPSKKKGEILIKLDSKIEGQFTLIISDNGIGFPEDLDFLRTKSLGLQLVKHLVKQLNGTIELNRISGTEYKIIFKEIKI